MDNPLLRRFFEETEAKIIQKWKTSDAEDFEGREKAFRYLAVLQEFGGYLKQFMANSDFAVAELERMMSDE